MKKVTFLMTVHNGEGFVRKSIESVLNQSEKDIALYIRNNASSDKSAEICKVYAKNDARITYLENRRDYITDDDIPAADRGWWPEFDSEYIAIVDHDDILDIDFTKDMYNLAKQADAELVIGGNSFFSEDTGEIYSYRLPPEILIDRNEELKKNFPAMYGCLRTVWGKLYRRDIFEKYFFCEMPQNLLLSQDTYHVFEILKHCKKIAAINKAVYHYCARSNSGFNSKTVEAYRIGEADILFDAAMECLECFDAVTEKNIEFLYHVHWGHMLDLLNILCNTDAMSLESKIEYIQDILRNERLGTYFNNSFKILWKEISEKLEVIIPSIKKADISLWKYYIIRLYEVFMKKEDESAALTYITLLSVLCDEQNSNHIGMPLLSDECFKRLSPGEERLKKLPEWEQSEYTGSPKRLKAFFDEMINEEELIKAEDALAEAADSENYELAGELLSKFNSEYPIGEYAFYYRIYLSELMGERIFAKKQAHIARVFWSESTELMELCKYIMNKQTTESEPEVMPKAEAEIPVVFDMAYLNTEASEFDDFYYLCSFIKKNSLVSLFSYAFAQKIKAGQQGEEGKICRISKEGAENYVKNTYVACFKSMTEGGATAYDAIRDMKAHIKDYAEIYECLSDDISKNTLRDIMLFRFLDDIRYLKRCSSSERQYYLPELLPERKNAVFVDCGAFDGQTVMEYTEVYGKNYKKIYVYEPAPENYINVCKNLAGLERITIYNRGVSDRPGTLRFTSSMPDTANRINPHGDKIVQISSLDEDIKEKITFIKMDIEGAEQSAIEGAENHIKEDKPELAICLYHIVEDIWKIPKRIKELNKEQKFYIRYHLDGSIPEEIVLYTSPYKK